MWQCANTSIFRLRTLIEPEQDVIVHYARFLINVPLLRSPFNLSVTLCTIFYFVTLFANIVSMNRKDREKNQNRVTRYRGGRKIRRGRIERGIEYVFSGAKQAKAGQTNADENNGLKFMPGITHPLRFIWRRITNL